jgi:hypothetical protein
MCTIWILFLFPVNPGYSSIIFNPPMKFDLIKLRDAVDGWVLDVRISEQYVCYLNFIFVAHECWLLGCYFWSRPWNSTFKVEGHCWIVDPRCQILWIIHVLSEFYFCSPWCWLLGFPTREIRLDKVEGRCWRVGPGSQTIWKRNVCLGLDFILFPVIVGYLAFIFEPGPKIPTW